MDQIKTTYQIDRRSTNKFYLRLFFDLLDIAVNNACCVYNDLTTLEETVSKRLKNLEYRQMIARYLIGVYSNRERKVPRAVTGRFSVAAAAKPEHVMIKNTQRNRCVQCKKIKRENRTYNICQTCQVYLCYTTDRNCFAAYHEN